LQFCFIPSSMHHKILKTKNPTFLLFLLRSPCAAPLLQPPAPTLFFPVIFLFLFSFHLSFLFSFVRLRKRSECQRGDHGGRSWTQKAKVRLDHPQVANYWSRRRRDAEEDPWPIEHERNQSRLDSSVGQANRWWVDFGGAGVRVVTSGDSFRDPFNTFFGGFS